MAELPSLLKSRPAYSPNYPASAPWNGCLDVDGVRMYAGDGVAEAVDELISWGRPLGADTETMGVDIDSRSQVKCVTLGREDDDHEGLAVVLDPRRADHRQLIQKVFKEAEGLVFHNLPFDAIALYESGILTDLDWLDKAWDTLVASRMVLRPTKSGMTFERNTLEKLLWDYLGVGADPSTKPLASVARAHGFTTGKTDAGNNWYQDADLDIPAYAIGAMSDVVHLPRLLHTLRVAALEDMANADSEYRPGVDQAEHVFTREQVVNRCMTRANTRGFDVDEEYCRQYFAEATEKLSATVPALVELGWLVEVPDAGEDAPLWRRFKPVRAAVPDTLAAEGLIDLTTYPRTATGKLSTEENSLRAVTVTMTNEAGKSEQVTDPRIEDWLDFVDVQKTCNDYLEKTLASRAPDGKVRSHANVLNAVTGRMSYEELPLQQYSDAGRRAIAAHNWVSIDWTAVEPVTAAALAGDWTYVSQVEGGADPYIPVARAAGLVPEDLPDYPPQGLTGKEADSFPCARNHPGRKQAKVVLLGMLYGKGPRRLAEELGTDVYSASLLDQRVKATMPLIHRKLECQETVAKQKGYISSASGRLLRVKKDAEGAYRGYMAKNYLCQGSAYDVLAETIFAAEQRGLGHKIHIAVHDELIVDADAQEEFEELMQGAMSTLSRVTVQANEHRFCTDVHALPTHWKKV